MWGSTHRAYLFWIGIITLFMGTIISVGGTWAEEERPKQLVIGYQQFPTADIVLKDQGWLEEDLGMAVKWVPIPSGMHALEPLAKGELDFALVGNSPAAAGVARGVPLQIIWIHDIIGDNEALVAKNGSGINKVEDLIGKTVAVPFGSTTHYDLMVSMMLYKVNPKNVNVVFLEPPEILSAWKRGEIDAAFIWEPTLFRLEQEEGKIIITSRQLTERGFPTADLGAVRKDFGEKYPAVVVTYLKNLDKAVKFCRSNPDRAAASIARQLDMPEADALRQLKSLILLTAEEQDRGKYFGGTYWNFGIYTLLKETADFLMKEGVVESLPARDAFMEAVNASFLTKVVEVQ